MILGKVSPCTQQTAACLDWGEKETVDEEVESGEANQQVAQLEARRDSERS